MLKILYSFFTFSLLLIYLAVSPVSSAQTEILVSDDAFTRGGAANADSTWGIKDSTLLRLRLPNNGDTSFTRYIYFKFDLTGVTGTIDSAFLKVTVNQSVSGNSAANTAIVDFYKISDDNWGENTITWNNQPAAGPHILTFYFPGQNTTDPKITYFINVTNYTQEEYAGDKVLSIMGRGDTLSNDLNASLLSKENATATEDQKAYLVVYTSPVIPVELNSFTASNTGNSISLEWITSTEKNNAGFEVQRSKQINGSWENISFVRGHGTTTKTNSYSFVDQNPGSGKSYYRLKQIDLNGQCNFSKIVEAEIARLSFSLSQNYPNPFNPSTEIYFTLPEKSFVTLKVYNSIGQTVAVLLSELKDTGSYEITFSGVNLSSGTYLYKLTTDNGLTMTRKMILMK